MNEAAPHDALLQSNVLGRYRIVRKLASGGMGAVYLGRTEGAQGFARPVVIKRVLPALMDDREIAQLFVREAQILSNLQHPNIVSVLDFGLQDDAYVMVLEYVQGYQLAEWMRYLRRASAPMPVDFALHIAIRVLDALHYAHTFKRSDGAHLKIIHRDISPSNVLLGELGMVKLLDFGIARVSGDEGSTFKTERPRVRGKLPYLPLEMFKGTEPNERSDIYSLGVVLYEMLTGKNPFVGRDTAEIYFKILNTEAPSVHASRDDAPEAIDQVFSRALAKDANTRFASAAEMAAALRALRSESDEVVAARFTERLRADFAGPLLEALGVEPLSALESAWRSPESIERSERPPVLDPAIAEDRTEPSLDSSMPALVPPRAPAAPATSSAHVSSATHAASPTLGSARRIALVVALAAIVGAISAGGLWLAIEGRNENDPVVVIQREANTARSPLGPPSAPTTALAQPAPAQPAALPAQADTVGVTATLEKAARAEPARSAATTAKPAAPSPQRLTRAFGRQQKKIEACFAAHEVQLQGQPQIAVHFHVDARGQVLDASLSPEPLTATALGRCLIGVARTASFGPQQAEVAFHIPITAQKVP